MSRFARELTAGGQTIAAAMQNATEGAAALHCALSV